LTVAKAYRIGHITCTLQRKKSKATTFAHSEIPHACSRLLWLYDTVSQFKNCIHVYLCIYVYCICICLDVYMYIVCTSNHLCILFFFENRQADKQEKSTGSRRSGWHRRRSKTKAKAKKQKLNRAFPPVAKTLHK